MIPLYLRNTGDKPKLPTPYPTETKPEESYDKGMQKFTPWHHKMWMFLGFHVLVLPENFAEPDNSRFKEYK